MSTTAIDAPQVVKDMARDIADNIRRNGHWKGDLRPGSKGDCIIANGGFECRRSSEKHAFVTTLAQVAGFDADVSLDPVFKWNDTTPTEEVLRVLDEIAGVEV